MGFRTKTNGKVVAPATFDEPKQAVDEGAVERVERFLRMRELLTGLDADLITGVSSPTEHVFHLTVTDLRELIEIARQQRADRDG